VQNIRIYAAPSLLEVIKQLLIYRPTGVLTIWPATSTRQEDTRITIELGRPIYVYRGLHWENATESIMAWLNTWGEIHFSFQSQDAHLRLPSPRAQQDFTPEAPMNFAMQRQKPLSTATQPHLAISTQSKQALSSPGQGENRQRNASPSSTGRTRGLPQHDLLRQEENKKSGADNNNWSPATAQEMAIATLTAHGRAYSAAHLPRYDRTIFLLINGRRTVADLSQLTKRPQEDVFASIHRLWVLQLITIETRASR
jgi:hypothetical protein